MKIAYILLTNGLEYDDRIRKEMFSMKELLGEVEFKVFGFHGDNHVETGVLSYGVPFELVSLKNRGGKKGLIAMLRKEYDFYKQIAPKVNDFDMLWVCDHQPFFFPLLSKKPVIWDLHEIPETIIGSRIKNFLFHRMERRCKWLIHANKERIDYLISQGVVNIPSKNLILRNFPDKSWLTEKGNKSVAFREFKKWIGDDEYIYIQGINGSDRFAWETLSAVMEAKCIKAVVIGSIQNEIKEKIADTYPDTEKYIYYTGQVLQLETAAFISNCKFSMVFYNTVTPNNRYCEPNRMFQCLGMGKPVITGCNEPMKNIIEEYGNGIGLKSDGGDVAEIAKAIKQMMCNYELFKSKAEEHGRLFAWEAQMPIFKKLFRKR